MIALTLALQVIQPTPVAAASPFEAGSQAAQALDAAVQPVAPLPVQTVQDVLLEVCDDHGYADKKAEDCAKHLLGMLWKESRNVANAVGDHGLALGYFQIHYKMHGVTRECATDLRCSAGWTIDYLEKHSYPKYVKYAIQCHNGCDFDNGYADSVLRNARRLWDQPMAVVQPDFQMALAKN